LTFHPTEETQTEGILPHHYTASQRRRQRLEWCGVENSRSHRL